MDDEPNFQVGEDGEVDFEAFERKPKGKPKPFFLPQRSVQISLPLLLALAAAMVCSAALLLIYTTGNRELICRITFSCPQPTSDYSPSAPRTVARVFSINGIDMVTVTPSVYTAPTCEIADLMVGSKIMYVLERSDNAEIFVVDMETRNSCRLTNNLIGEAWPSWSPDRRQVVFSADRPEGIENIYRMNIDGSNLVNLTNSLNGAFAPMWSPDGTQIAYLSYQVAGTNVYMMNADGSNRRNLSNMPSGDYGVDWSPDGQWLAFSSVRDGDYDSEIYKMDTNGENIQQLTNNDFGDWDTAWSPNGDLIAYTSDPLDAAGSDIFIMNVDGSNARRLTFDGVLKADLEWSLDGTRLAFISDGDLYTINIEGIKEPELLVQDFNAWWGLSWR